MTKQRQKSVYRSLSACLLLLFAGLVMAPILSATGKAGAGKAAPEAAPTETVGNTETVALAEAQPVVTHRHGRTVRLSPAQIGDYDGAEYAGTTGGGDSFVPGGRGAPGHRTFAEAEIGAGVVPMLTPYNYVHSGPAGSSGRRPAGKPGAEQPGGNPGTPQGEPGPGPEAGTGPGPDEPPVVPEPPITPEPPVDPEPPIDPEPPTPPVAEVPEPSALALLALGIVGLVVARRRAR